MFFRHNFGEEAKILRSREKIHLIDGGMKEHLKYAKPENLARVRVRDHLRAYALLFSCI